MNLSSFFARVIQFMQPIVLYSWKWVVGGLLLLFFGYYFSLFFKEKTFNYPIILVFAAAFSFAGFYFAQKIAKDSVKTLKKRISKDLDKNLKVKILTGLSYKMLAELGYEDKTETRISNSELDYITGEAKKLIEQEIENVYEDYFKQHFFYFFAAGVISTCLLPALLFLFSRIQI